MGTFARLKALAGVRPRGRAFATSQWQLSQVCRSWAATKSLGVTWRAVDEGACEENDAKLMPGETDNTDQHRQRLAEKCGLDIFDVPDTASKS